MSNSTRSAKKRKLEEERNSEFKSDLVKAQKRARTNKHPVAVLYRNYEGEIHHEDPSLTEEEIEDRLAIAIAPKVAQVSLPML